MTPPDSSGDGSAHGGVPRLTGSPDGAKRGFVPPAPSGVQTKSRVPELALGLLLIVLFSLGGILVLARVGAKSPALMIVQPVAAGELIPDSAVKEAGISSDEPIVGLSNAQRDRIVGRVARADIVAGTLASESLVVQGGRIGPGMASVGLALSSGQFPSGVASGDLVQGVLVPTREVDFGAERPPVLIGSPVEVLAVEPLNPSGSEKLITVVMIEAEAAHLSTAHAVDVVHLIEVPR